MKIPTYTILLFGAFLVCSLQGHSQGLKEELAALDAELDEIFSNESDSLSLVALIDRLVKPVKYTELQLRTSYSSRVTSAGRDFGIDQQGIVPGVSLYHKSGFFGDVSGFWNSQLDPNYNLTIVTLGYQNQLNKNWSYTLTYDHSFYAEEDTLNALTKSLSGAVTYFFKKFYTGLDYSFSFGDDTAHRIIWNMTGNLKLGKLGPFDKIVFLPSVATLFGNQNITSQYVNATALDRFTNLSDRQFLWYINQLDLSRAEIIILRQAQQGLVNDTLSEDQLALINEYFSLEQTEQAFDLLNYYLTLPIIFYRKSLSFSVSYNYNIPRNISNTVSHDPNGYFGFMMAYSFRL